jgi:hypothetical protein
MTELTFKLAEEFLGAHPHTIFQDKRSFSSKTPAQQRAFFEKTFAFTDRETYLAWVQEWKSLLKSVESLIRIHKAARRGEDMWTAQSNAHRWGEVAHGLQCQRRLGKVYAGHLRAECLAFETSSILLSSLTVSHKES